MDGASNLTASMNPDSDQGDIHDDDINQTVVSVPHVCSLKFTVTDGVVLPTKRAQADHEEQTVLQTIDFENFTGQCELEAHKSAISVRSSSSNPVGYDHGADYAAGAGEILPAHVAGAASVESGSYHTSYAKIVSSSGRILHASANIKSTSQQIPNNEGSDANANVKAANKVHLQTEHEYGISLIKRERLNFYDASIHPLLKKKTTLFGIVPNPMMSSSSIIEKAQDDLASTSKASVDSSITNSVMSVTSNISLFSQGNVTKMRKMTAFQPMKAEKDLSVCCNVCGEAFSSIVSGKKRHNCRYCKDTVCTNHSTIDPNLPVPFKNVRLCNYCNTDVTAGRYRTLRRFYTSLVYLKPMSFSNTSFYPVKEYEQLRVALSALCQELDAMLVKIKKNSREKSVGAISVSPAHFVHALGRHLYASNPTLEGGLGTEKELEELSKSDQLVPDHWKTLQFRDLLYQPTRLLSTLLAICHIQRDYRYALACHDPKDSRQNVFPSLQYPVDVIGSLCSILEVDAPAINERDHAREEGEVLHKAIAISQEQAARSLFYITHPEVYALASNTEGAKVADVAEADRILQCTIKCLQKAEMTHLYPRFGIALIHSLLLHYGSQLTLDLNLVQTLTTLLAASEDLDARVHSIGAMLSLLQLPGNDKTVIVTGMILDAPDFNFYSIAELLSLGDDLICYTCVQFLCAFSKSELDVNIELSNENSCLKALVLLLSPDVNNKQTSDEQLLMVHRILQLFTNMAAILLRADECTGVMATRRQEGLQNFQSEKILTSAYKILESLSESNASITSEDDNSASFNTFHLKLFSQCGKLVSLLHSYFVTSSPLNSADVGKKVYWGEPNNANNAEVLGKAAADVTSGNIAANVSLPVHKLVGKKFFSYKQLDYMLVQISEKAATSGESVEKVLSETDESGKIPLQILANNKEFITENIECLCEIIQRLVAEYPRSIMRQDDRALSPFFVAINDWAVFAQRGYEDNIHAQKRKFKLSRFRIRNLGTRSTGAGVTLSGNRLISPRLEMPEYVYASLLCLSHIVDYLGYEGQYQQSSILSEFDVVKFVAQTPDFLKLLFFIEDATMRDKVLNLSIVQRALIYDDYLSTDGGQWIRDLPAEKYQVFVEKWLYAFDVAKSRYRLSLKDYPPLLAKEDRKREAIVDVMKSIIQKAVADGLKANKKASKQKKKNESFDNGTSSSNGLINIDRYRFLNYYLDFVL